MSCCRLQTHERKGKEAFPHGTGKHVRSYTFREMHVLRVCFHRNSLPITVTHSVIYIGIALHSVVKRRRQCFVPPPSPHPPPHGLRDIV